MQRRKILKYLAFMPTFSQSVYALNLKEIRIISPFPPGASVDFWARQIAEQLRDKLSIDANVFYAPGASGIVGANQLLNEKSNSNPALLISSGALFAQIPKIPNSGLKFDPNKTFRPISILWEEPLYLAVRTDSTISNLEDLLNKSRKYASAPSFGSSGANSTSALLMGHMAKHNSLAWNHVPYQGLAPMITDLLGGHIDFGVFSYQSIKKLLEAKKLRLIATTGNNRNPLHPDCPSLRESGILDIDGNVWFGLFSNAELSSAVFEKIEKVIIELFASDKFRAKALENEFIPLGLAGSEALRYIKKSNSDWASVMGVR